MERNELSSVRIGKVSFLIPEKKPSEIIPFNGNLPLVDPLQYQEFLTKIDQMLFVNLSDEVKGIVYKAEKIKYMNDSFEQYLNDIGVGTGGFKNMTNEKKADTLFAWMNKEKLDHGSLKI